MSSHWTTNQHFSKLARRLRREYDQAFANPMEATSKRFCWDYWFVKNQYRLMRTPALHFFSTRLWSEFEDGLRDWGRENLACEDISPPWLSYYFEGCEQGWHADVPHGPWAFVFSLSNVSSFQGGRTAILKPSTLRFWNSTSFDRGLERDDLIEFVEPKFGQLLVFNPMFPHSVETVRGALDPLSSRVVIHGWFLKPKAQIVVEKKFGKANMTNMNRIQALLKRLETEIGKRLRTENSFLVGNALIQLKKDQTESRLRIKTLRCSLFTETGEEVSEKNFEVWLQDVLSHTMTEIDQRDYRFNLKLPLMFRS